MKELCSKVVAGMIAATKQIIRLRMLRVLNIMASRVHPVQSVHFIISVPLRHVHRGIPPVVPPITAALGMLLIFAIKHVQFLVTRADVPADTHVRIILHPPVVNNIMAAVRAMEMGNTVQSHHKRVRHCVRR